MQTETVGTARFRRTGAVLLFGGLIVCAVAALAHDGVHVEDARVEVAADGKSASVYLTIENHQSGPDRLTGAFSRAAGQVVLVDAQGEPFDEGVVIPTGVTDTLTPEGPHLALSGFSEALTPGSTFPITFVFEAAGELTMDIPVIAGGD